MYCYRHIRRIIGRYIKAFYNAGLVEGKEVESLLVAMIVMSITPGICINNQALKGIYPFQLKVKDVLEFHYSSASLLVSIRSV